MSENRKLNGIRYSCGIILYALFLAECAQRFSQRGRQIWIALNWSLIFFTWNKHSLNKCVRKKSFSQSCISRFLKVVDYKNLTDKFNQDAVDKFASEWIEVKKKYKNEYKK